MRAIAVARFGGPENLQLMDMPQPAPEAGEALVQIEYAGINFIDIYMRSGHYARSHTYRTPLPMVIGMEGAGRVSAFALGKGHTCLVHAGAGGVGQLLIQLAKLRGATVIATVGSEEKAAIARSRGADHVLLYREVDFREEVMRITGGKGVDVVYDAVGKDTISRSIHSLKRRGLCVNYGGASGLVQSIEPLELAEAGSVFFTRPHLADYIATPEELHRRATDLFAAHRAGKLAVPIDRELPLAEAAEAHRYLEGRNTKGKLLLRI